MKRFLFLVLLCLLFISMRIFVYADEYDDITNQLNDLKKALDSSQRATANNEQTLRQLNSQLESIKQQVVYLENEIAKKEKEVKEGEEKLGHQKKLLDERIVSYYKNIGKNTNSFVQIFLSDNLSTSLQQFFYQKTILDEDKKTIISLVMRIKELEDKKTALSQETERLKPIKEEVDKQSKFMAGEVEKSKQYESELQQKIVQLTARQQEILSQRLASLNIPQSAYTTQGGCNSDIDVDPGFSPRIAFFSFGVPHRVGMNQYGAKGRAEAGQNVQQILQSYYNADYTTGYNTDITIHVTGTNEYGQTFDDQWNIEEYVKHVYEVPTNWPAEVLKAQAIAARSYALAVTNNGASTICPSQSCQVVKKEYNSDAWKQAVDDTKGVVLTSGGTPIKAWFSSTHGGYVFSSAEVWGSGTSYTKHATDTTSGGAGSFDELKNNAYDKSSPWFYCDWGSRADHNKTAWLKPDEVADIVNTLLLVKRDSGTSENLYQTDKSNPAGKETWSADKVKSELRARGGSPYNNISDISIGADFGYGRTSSITVNGDAGSNTFDGREFKDRFNLRAPANLQIVSLLYNVERK